MTRFLDSTAARLVLLFFVLLQTIATSFGSDELSGKVVGITDGDTLTLLLSGNHQVKIRLSEIDAPERGQPFSTQSKTILSDLVFGKVITVQNTTNDRSGRIVGRVYTDSKDISAEMVRLGAAWVYSKYSEDAALPPLQDEAQFNRVGLWSLKNPIPPWEWRYKQRVPVHDNKVPTCAIKGNINRKGDRIYHIPGSRDYASTVINTSRGERWFCNETDAQSAGWRAPRK